MPKVRTVVNGVFSVPEPVVDDPKALVAQNRDLIGTAPEDGLVVPLPDSTINDFIDASQILITAASATDVPGDPDGVGLTPLEYKRKGITINGVARVAKYSAARRGRYAIGPFGIHFTSPAADYVDAIFTTAITAATNNLSGDGSIKFGSFLAYEARLVRAAENAVNRKPDYSDGNAQSVRVALMFAYERDLLWLQEVVNGLGRILGWYQMANKYCMVDPSLVATGTLHSPEFYQQYELLAKIVGQYPTMDADTHQTLQFLNDFHLVERKFIRLPTVVRESVEIHNGFFTGTLEDADMAPICSRITTVEHNVVATAVGHATMLYDLPTQDWVDFLVCQATTANALLALKEVVKMAGDLKENYGTLLKFINILESKKIAVTVPLSQFLYFDGKHITAVEPYFSFTQRAIARGLPMMVNIEGAAPCVYCKILLLCSTGAMDASGRGLLQTSFSGNVVEFGTDASDKLDSIQEVFWQIWKQYAMAGANVDLNGLCVFMNPFNGIIYCPDTCVLAVTHATSCALTVCDMSMGAVQTVGIVARSTAAIKNYLSMVPEGGTHVTGVAELDLNGAIFGSPMCTDKMEMHSELFDQMFPQLQCFGTPVFYSAATNTAGETGFLDVKTSDWTPDNLLFPISDDYFRRHTTDYYSKIFPALEDLKTSTPN